MMERILMCLLTAVAMISGVGSHTILCVKPSTSMEDSPSECSTTVTTEQLFSNSGKYIDSNMSILFEKGSHTLKGTLIVKQKKNLTIEGYDSTVTIDCKTENFTGFRFYGIQGLHIRNLSFQHCGRLHIKDSTFQRCDGVAHYEDAVLTFREGINLNITHVRINDTTGAGINCSNVNGVTNITNLTVTHSHIIHCNTTNEFKYNCSKGTLIIKDSMFANNRFSNCSDKLLKLLKPTVSVYIYKSDATALINNTLFFNNDGGNLGIDIHGTTKENQVVLQNSNLTNGTASKGGGLHLNIHVHEESNNTENGVTIVKIDSVLFECNKAVIGGGIYMEQKNHPNASKSKSIMITKSNFTNNTLVTDKRGGVGLHSITYILRGSITQVIPQYKPILTGCIFRHNRVSYDKSTTEATGNGVIFINKNEYFGIVNVTVSDNECSAILAVTSNLVFRGRTLLSSNRAASGGGLLLCKNGILYFTRNASLIIVNNTVQHTGGGICVETQCLQTRPRCFFQFDNVTDWKMLETINITVKDNTASHAGHNLFGGLVDFCYMLDDTFYQGGGNLSLNIYKKTFHIDTDRISSVTSIPQHVCLCDTTTNKTECTAEPKPYETYPGGTISIPVIPVGQLNGSVPGTIYATVINGEINDPEQYQHIDSWKCTNLSYTIHSVQNTSVPATLQLTIDHTGDISGYIKIPSSVPLNITVNIKDCPIGFSLSGGNICNCSLLNINGVSCSLSSKVIVKEKGTPSWIGANKNTVVYYEYCPYDYCLRDKKIYINVDSEHFLQDNQCSDNRTGTLCGMCLQNFSMVLGSSKCKHCPNKFVSLILLFGLAGFALVAVLTCLNLTVAEGTLSGLIFYANIVWYNKDLFEPNQQQYTAYSTFLYVFLAWLNLDLGITTCFFDGMDTYQKAWLQFAFPVYVWTISIAIIFLSKHFQIIARIAGKNAVKILATLILLSYTKFTQAAVRIFANANLQIILNGSITTQNKTLWLEDANVEYFETRHLIIFCFSIFFLAISFPFTLTLLFIKQLHWISHTRLFQWVQKLKPFLDAYTGPYTDYARFWPGLLLLVRIILSVVSGADSDIQCPVGTFTILLLFGISKMIKQGLYVKFHLDKLETLFLLNLGSLYLITAYYIKYPSNNKCQRTYYIVLVGLAFLTFVGIVMYHTWLKCRHYRHTVIMIEKINAKVTRIGAKFRRKETTSMDRLQNYPPFVRYTEDREPLLADHED